MRASLGCRRVDSGESISEPVVPAGTLEAEGTGVGSEVSTAVVFPVGPRMTGFLWGTGSSAQPGEDETESQGGTDARTHARRLSQPCSGTYAGSVAAYGAQTQHASGGHGSLAPEQGTRGRTHTQVGCPSQGTCRRKVQRKLEVCWKWWPQWGMGGHPPPQGQTCSKLFQIPFLECGG